MKVDWKPISEAPKNDDYYTGPWLFGRNKYDEYRVIRWTTEYPCTEGCWMYAYSYDQELDYSEIQEFDPVEFDYLPE